LSIPGEEVQTSGSFKTAVGLAFGRALSWYSRSAVHPAKFRVEGNPRPSETAVIWTAWHGSNLILLEAYRRLNPDRTLFLLIPPGLAGAVQCGRMAGTLMETLALPADGTGNPIAALKGMVRGLAAGNDVAIAPDGPAGPARRVRPGTLWLARHTGRPIWVVGCAARPCLRWPRWDRHVVPLPGASVAMVVDEPLHVDRGDDLEALEKSLAERLDAAERRARELLTDE
jgi:lysophospholipid acyltransferase (LPLAT)-like uncharacterized protein